MLLILMAACSSQRVLMPAPNLYQGSNAPELFNDLSEESRGNEIDLLFVTDRTPGRDDQGELAYGYGRSHSIAFGSAVVKIEPAMSWNELWSISLEDKRSTKLVLELDSIREIYRFPETPLPIVLHTNTVEIDPEALQQAQNAEQSLRQELLKRLEVSPRQEVILFVHGFNNQFDDAAKTLADLWHFLGREHVPILYTWPAGRGGPSGYVYDRESGEFTIFHLKNLLGLLGRIPEIEKIHLIAHSRGTDVLTSAIRELMLATKAAGKDPLKEFRIENLVLAAPDLDMDVVSQRFIAEYLGADVGRVTVYTSQGDKAIGMAERLFKSTGRIGKLSVDDLSKENLELTKNISGIAFVEVQESSDRTGHGYFHSSPEASSDLILAIRYGLDPGAENGRPMRQLAPVFWMIEPGYPAHDTSRP
jgi:esterase/lipase superfamily enzyme